MTTIPVYVQEPNKPKSEHFVGYASSLGDPEIVARKVGVPEGCLVDGKVISGKRGPRWSLVAYVGVMLGDPEPKP